MQCILGADVQAWGWPKPPSAGSVRWFALKYLLRWYIKRLINLKIFDATFVNGEAVAVFPPLAARLIDGWVLLAVKSLYSCQDVCVCFSKVISQPFTVGVGLQQRSVLSQFLFIIYINWMYSHSRVKEGVTAGNCRINSFLFADDFVHPWMLSHFFTQTRNRIALFRPCVQTSPRKIGEASPTGARRGESGLEVVQLPAGSSTSQPLLGPVLVWIQLEHS